MRYLNDLAYSVAKELAPEFKIPVYRKNKYFAFIINESTSLSVGDIKEISERVALKPLFMYIGSDSLISKTRFFSRKFDSKPFFLKSKTDFENAISECEFTVSENPIGAYFSILAHKSVYLNIKNEASRNFITEFISMNCGENIVIPYTKNRIGIIKKVRAKNSDFCYIIDKIRNKISKEIIEEFTP